LNSIGIYVTLKATVPQKEFQSTHFMFCENLQENSVVTRHLKIVTEIK